MIRTSVALSLFDGWNGMPALYCGTEDEILEEIQSLGYDGVDLFVDEPGQKKNQEALSKIRRYGLEVGAVMPALLARQGLSLGDRDESLRRNAIQRTGEIISFASEAGGMVSLGLVRGRAGRGEERKDFFKRLTESFEELLKLAIPQDVDLILEPINRYESDHLNSSLEALDYIRGCGLPLYLMLDTFHMNIEDVDLMKSFESCIPFVKHIHFVDSNRLAPGMGHLNMEDLYKKLVQLDYRGTLCLEALPYPSGHECARIGADFFSSMRTKRINDLR